MLARSPSCGDLRHDRVVFCAPSEICELVLDRGLQEGVRPGMWRTDQGHVVLAWSAMPCGLVGTMSGAMTDGQTDESEVRAACGGRGRASVGAAA